MRRTIGPTPALLTLGLAALVWGEDFPYARTRPLMALCAELSDQYGLFVTYEDAPADSATELNREIIPRNGNLFLSPKWRPVTFHIPDDLPTRSDATATLSGNADPERSLAAVQDLVKHYNESGNPGRFSVVQDGEYLHIQEIARTVGGKLHPFEPVSNTVIQWLPDSDNCEVVLGELSGALFKTRGIGIAQGNVPGQAMLTRHCRTEPGSLTVSQILEHIADSLGANNLTANKSISYTWDLVYDPNWNKYFLSLTPVRWWNLQPAPAQSPQPIPASAKSGSSSRIGYVDRQTSAKPPN